MKIKYCATLAWQPPPNIIDVVNDFARYIPQVGTYKKNHLVLAHSPSATNWQGHECDWRCRNYSLHCGVITLVNAAVLTLHSPLFQWLTGPVIRESIFLQRLTQYWLYLRRVLMSWFAESRIEIDYDLPPVGWSCKNTEKSDHTVCSRPNNATKSRGDLSSKLKDMPSTYESPSCDKPPSKKSSSSEENISSSSPGSSSVKSSPRCSTPTQCDETKPSQLSGKQPLTKSKSADGNVTVSSPTPKRSYEGSSRATFKKRKLSRLANKRLADMSRKTEDMIAQQPPKLSKDSVAQSAEQSTSSSFMTLQKSHKSFLFKAEISFY